MQKILHSRCAVSSRRLTRRGWSPVGWFPRSREPVQQCQPVEAFAKSPREIVDPALTHEATALADLLHGHAENQHLMHQRGAVGAEFAFGAVEPQHRLALALGDRLAHLAAIDIFPRRIDRLRAALGLLPIVLERPAALVLRLVDLAMAMQPP